MESPHMLSLKAPMVQGNGMGTSRAASCTCKLQNARVRIAWWLGGGEALLYASSLNSEHNKTERSDMLGDLAATSSKVVSALIL